MRGRGCSSDLGSNPVRSLKFELDTNEVKVRRVERGSEFMGNDKKAIIIIRKEN